MFSPVFIWRQWRGAAWCCSLDTPAPLNELWGNNWTQHYTAVLCFWFFFLKKPPRLLALDIWKDYSARGTFSSSKVLQFCCPDLTKVCHFLPRVPLGAPSHQWQRGSQHTSCPKALQNRTRCNSTQLAHVFFYIILLDNSLILYFPSYFIVFYFIFLSIVPAGASKDVRKEYNRNQGVATEPPFSHKSSIAWKPEIPNKIVLEERGEYTTFHFCVNCPFKRHLNIADLRVRQEHPTHRKRHARCARSLCPSRPDPRAGWR